MPNDEENHSHIGFDTLDHQPVFVYTPSNTPDEVSTPPPKRRKLAKAQTWLRDIPLNQTFEFEPLFNGLESPECIALRQETFERAWSETEAQIQSILDEANDDTLKEVTLFVDEARRAGVVGIVPTGFIVTGPNISSHSLLFNQLSVRLKTEVNGPIVVLRSSDASNLKAVLKQLLQNATNQKTGHEDEEGLSAGQDGRKLLNYDLEILHNYVNVHGSQAVVVAFQDSEAFDTALLSDLIGLFSSWRDRIPFVLLFGIATSVDLFHERLSRSASRFLDGVQFDVEQTSSLLERIFQKVVAGIEAPVRLGSVLVSSLMERQHDHIQSVHSFNAALKYAYMCHFYGNPISWLSAGIASDSLLHLVQPHHLEIIRTLPSFQRMLDGMVEAKQWSRARSLLTDDEALLETIEKSHGLWIVAIVQLLQAMSLLLDSSLEPVDKIELYIIAFQGDFAQSDFVKRALGSIKRMTPNDLLDFMQAILNRIENGKSEKVLPSRAHEDELLEEIEQLHAKLSALVKHSVETGAPIRSSYAIHSKGVRTTVVAQRVQLSYEDSTLTDQDKDFTSTVDHLLHCLKGHFSQLENPQEMFLNEAWLYDWTAPHKSVFTPRPREAIELALATPYRYLSCGCCESVEGLSSAHPATAILYQMYLETGSLINIFDLWSAFFEMVSGGEEQKCEERDALVLFYKALADMKSLGMVKQSKKKADHLAKVAWKGL